MTYRLRGNSFFLLLLRAAKEGLGNGNKNGLTRTDLWVDFLRVFDDKYNPREKEKNPRGGYEKDSSGRDKEVIAKSYENLKKYFSEYLNGEFHSGSASLPENLIEKAEAIFSSDSDYSSFSSALERLDYACNRYLDLSDGVEGSKEASKSKQKYQNKLVPEKLVAGIIETIKNDTTFKGPFFTGEKIVQKEELCTENEYILQLFLFDVWYKIVTEHYGDAKGGKETCADWTKSEERKKSGKKSHKPRVVTTKIGQERAKTLTVKTDIVQLDYTQTYRKLLSIYKPTEQDQEGLPEQDIGRPPLPTEIEPELKAHIDHWFKIYKSNDIPIKTPQMLYMLFCYPNCKLIKIFNAIQPDSFFDSISGNGEENILKPKSPYGDYLIKVCEHFNKLYEHNEEHYDESGRENFFALIKQGMEILQNELSGLNDHDYSFRWRHLFCTGFCTDSHGRSIPAVYIPAHTICYFLLKQTHSQILRMVQNQLGSESFKVLLQSVKSNTIPTFIGDSKLFSVLGNIFNWS